MAGQITGAEAVLEALREGTAITMVLVDREKTRQKYARCVKRQEFRSRKVPPTICGECPQMAMWML